MHVPDQEQRFPSGNGLEDMRIAKGELVVKYLHPNPSGGYVSPHSKTGGETLVTSSACDMPTNTRVAVVGQAISDFDPAHFTKNPLVTVMPSGFTVLTNTGPEPLRAGEYFAVKAPSLAPGAYHYRCTSGAKVAFQTVTLRLHLDEFFRPIHACTEDLDRTLVALESEGTDVADLLKDDADIKQYGSCVRHLCQGEAEGVSVAAFNTALGRDCFQLKGMMDKYAAEYRDPKDGVKTAKMYRHGWKFFKWVGGLCKHTDNEERAAVCVFREQTQYLQYVNLYHINTRREICGGMVVGNALPKSLTMPAILGRVF